MRVLFLQSDNCHCEKLKEFLIAEGEDVIAIGDKITLEQVQEIKPEIAVSYNYRYILKQDVLSLFKFGAVNLHISYLPWNRGADPNFWSHAEGTPSGVTIHYIDEGVDTGDIIAQELVAFSSEHTLRTSYDVLHSTVQKLFYSFWGSIRLGAAPIKKQDGVGTSHRTKDKKPFLYLLEQDGFDTPLWKVIEMKLDHFKIHR